jgi:hypothetical protein
MMVPPNPSMVLAGWLCDGAARRCKGVHGVADVGLETLDRALYDAISSRWSRNHLAMCLGG